MMAVWPGKTAAARSRNVSGVSDWKFAGLRSRSVSYGVGAMARSLAGRGKLNGLQGEGSIADQAARRCRSGVGERSAGAAYRSGKMRILARVGSTETKCPISQLLLRQL